MFLERPVSGTLPETSQPSTAPPRTRRGVPAASADANHLDEVLTRRRLNVIGDWSSGGMCRTRADSRSPFVGGYGSVRRAHFRSYTSRTRKLRVKVVKSLDSR